MLAINVINKATEYSTVIGGASLLLNASEGLPNVGTGFGIVSLLTIVLQVVNNVFISKQRKKQLELELKLQIEENKSYELQNKEQVKKHR